MVLPFLSTPPSRVATVINAAQKAAIEVSIHATLAGGDAVFERPTVLYTEFLATPPSRVASGTLIFFITLERC